MRMVWLWFEIWFLNGIICHFWVIQCSKRQEEKSFESMSCFRCLYDGAGKLVGRPRWIKIFLPSNSSVKFIHKRELQLGLFQKCRNLNLPRCNCLDKSLKNTFWKRCICPDKREGTYCERIAGIEPRWTLAKVAMMYIGSGVKTIKRSPPPLI